MRPNGAGAPTTARGSGPMGQTPTTAPGSGPGHVPVAGRSPSSEVGEIGEIGA
ncbi:hypothetical protein [Streptomyces sp. NPDC058308]|uniref:hypothetical protein n=1 Tax=Streptomyces sp. NPDC058308 TaxID=3346440 RepID=UPI0036E5FA76